MRKPPDTHTTLLFTSPHAISAQDPRHPQSRAHRRIRKSVQPPNRGREKNAARLCQNARKKRKKKETRRLAVGQSRRRTFISISTYRNLQTSLGSIDLGSRTDEITLSRAYRMLCSAFLILFSCPLLLPFGKKECVICARGSGMHARTRVCAWCAGKGAGRLGARGGKGSAGRERG